MGKGRSALAALAAGWFCLTALAPPHLVVARLPEPAALLSAGGTAAEPVAPGEQYPPEPHQRALPSARPAPRRAPDVRLAVDVSATADSNRTNGSDLKTVPIDFGNGPLPVPLDPNLREKAGVGIGASTTANVRLPVAKDLALALDAEGYVVDYAGGASDDQSLLLAGGFEFGSGAVPDASVQLIAFDRWYGGVNAMEGVGLRANYRQPLGKGETLRLAVDARVFDSAYGEAFGGSQASLYLSYDSVLDPSTSASIGGWAHREWLNDDVFSYTEAGLYGGLSHYLGPSLTGGVTAGVSRTWFDAPFLMLGPDARRDWRLYGSVWVASRRPVLLGVTPSLTYTYNRTSSSIGYYRSDRHRLRFGLGRKF
ncbi:MAG: surface lipoprotein assembly modifier [Allosphingosinicella sp.]